jgi:hypothetical protein
LNEGQVFSFGYFEHLYISKSSDILYVSDNPFKTVKYISQLVYYTFSRNTGILASMVFYYLSFNISSVPKYMNIFYFQIIFFFKLKTYIKNLLKFHAGKTRSSMNIKSNQIMF